jgi:hypothetical protein
LFRFGGSQPLHNAKSSIFCCRGGRPLHKVQFLIFCSPLDILVARFTNSSPKAFLLNSSDVLSILRGRCRLVPGFFLHLLPRSSCPGPWSHIPLLHSGPFQRLFPNVRPFQVSCTTLSWSYLLWSCPLRHVTFVLWVILLPAAANSFHDPQFLWVQIFLKTFLLCHATAAQQDAFLQAAANFLQDPQSPRVSSCGSLHHPMARCRPMCRLFIVPEDFTAASS